MKLGVGEYVAINQEYLLDQNKKIDFDIFVVRERNNKKMPVLLANKDTLISEVREKIAKNFYGKLYIRKESVKSFEEFLEDSVSDIITDATIPIEQKSQIIYDCSKNIIKDVFEDPRSGKNIGRTKKITNNIIDFILQNENSVLNLLHLGSHDYYTFTHCVNVSVFAVGLWLMIGKGREQELRDFAFGCILHDVGKAEISEKILRKPGKLNDAEFAVIREHPQKGYDLMKDSAAPLALDVILHHHEKYSGDGYPDGLHDTEISDHAKIAAIADVYDALTTNRPYSDARRPFHAVLLMKEEMVGHFEQEKFIQFINFLGSRIN